MSAAIQHLTIEGYRSIRKLERLQMRPLNVLIGANGAGKSNFVGFFRLLRALIEQQLQLAVATMERGADCCLFLGPKVTKRLSATVRFGKNAYAFSLVPTPDNRLVFESEEAHFHGDYGFDRSPLGSGHSEAKLKDHRDDPGTYKGAARGVPSHVYEAISSWVVYHFHDTSLSAGVRRVRAINDNESLRQDADNLAAVLFRLQKTNSRAYTRIRDAVRLAAPFFDDFKLRPIPTDPNNIQLEWLQKGSDYPFQAHQLSDGTLRFICLATALLQEPIRPSTMIFDEPELGLHPFALTLLGRLFLQASRDRKTQLVISTQSTLLLNDFAPEDIIVVERHEGESVFRRLDSAELSEWLEDYTLGELWQKNVLGGRPRPEDTPELVPKGSAGKS